MAVNLSPIGNDAPFMDSNGDPLSGGLLYFYTAGSSTATDTYTTSAGSTPNANPVVLNSNGYPASGGNVVEIWFTAGVSYKCILKTSAGVTVWTRDNLVGINDTAVTIDQWVSGAAPTYVSGTSFTLVGDQTSTYHVGRRLKTTNSGGTVYSTIVTSAYGALTTITVVNDSGSLDSGLSAVYYGLLSATNPSTPLLTDAYPIVSGSADKTKKLRFEVDGFTTATTRVATPANYDIRVGNLPAGIGPVPYAGSTIPTGWLECDGSAVSRTTYADLFAAISTTWGVGDGSTTFNLPDMRGKVAIGSGTGTTTEAVTASSSNGFTVTSNSTKWITGMTVVLSNLSGFTTSASAGPTYYAVRISDTNVRLATTLALAQTGAPDVTLSGTGTATLTNTYTARTLGQYGGEESHAMSSTEILAHVHSDPIGGSPSGSAGVQFLGNSGGSTGSYGGNAAMNVMQPFAVTKYIISY